MIPVRQVGALNPEAINKQDHLIINTLRTKYNGEVLWPIIISKLNTDSKRYIYEFSHRHAYNQIDIVDKPLSNSNIPNLFIDYVNKELLGPINENWKSKFLECEDTYNFIQQHDEGNNFRTVDVDYLWKAAGQWKAIELTTFFVSFKAIDVARKVIQKMNRRPTWQGANGMIAWRSIIDFANDINANIYVVCMSSASSTDTTIIPGSNAYIFPLTSENLDRISKGEIPENDVFLSFSEFEAWL